MKIIIITGMSGAGKSTAIDALADLGMYCVDNLPVPLLKNLIELLDDLPDVTEVAVGIDARSKEHLEPFAEARAALEAKGHKLEVLFLEAPETTILRRFSETRRRHPLGDLPEAIEKEVSHLAGLRLLATSTIDTDRLKGRDLRQLLRDRYADHGALSLVLVSFGFKNGLPSAADIVFDVRFLQNPHDVPELRPLSGFDPIVAEYVLEQRDAGSLLDTLEGLLRFQVPRSMAEGRSCMTVAIGCTGGQHRSVAMIEALSLRIRGGVGATETALPNTILSVRHRDVDRGLKNG